jgi:aspartate 1-decarboxylase
VKSSLLLKSKLHFARVTDSNLEYEGSLSIDQDLMDKVRIVPYEKILVADVENGNRFETYAIPAERGAGMIGLNGATAYQGAVGDRLIIFAFCVVPADEVSHHRPLVLVLDENNRPVGGLKEV